MSAPRKPGSEGKPWSDPESDPLADIRDAADRAREGSMTVDFGPPPPPSLYQALGDEAAR